MKRGNSSNWVHWLYAARTGTLTSIDFVTGAMVTSLVSANSLVRVTKGSGDGPLFTSDESLPILARSADHCRGRRCRVIAPRLFRPPVAPRGGWPQPPGGRRASRLPAHRDQPGPS